MKTQYQTIIAISSLALTACFDETPIESAHTVSWFLNHNTALDGTLEICSDNPAKYQMKPDCINAHHAANQRFAGEMHPIEWTPELYPIENNSEPKPLMHHEDAPQKNIGVSETLRNPVLNESASE